MLLAAMSNNGHENHRLVASNVAASYVLIIKGLSMG